jgi:hypothetical protein
MPVERSTKCYCFDACRQAAHRTVVRYRAEKAG